MKYLKLFEQDWWEEESPFDNIGNKEDDDKEFKIGDKVKCVIDAWSDRELIFHKIYVVKGVRFMPNTTIKQLNFNSNNIEDRWWNAFRFEKIK